MASGMFGRGASAALPSGLAGFDLAQLMAAGAPGQGARAPSVADGTTPAFSTPGIGGGMSQEPPSMDLPAGALVDYVGAISPRMTPGMFAAPPPPKKPKFFDEGGTGRAILGGMGDALSVWSGGQPIYAPIMQNKLKMRMEEVREEREARRRLREPQQVGRQIVQMREDGSYAPVYSAPSPAEEYATALGWEPGSEGFIRAVEDYALKGWGGTAFGRKQTLQDDRQAGQVDLAGVRYGYQDQLQDQRLEQSDTNNRRTTSTSRENNIRTTGQSNTNNLRTTNQSNANSQRAAEGRKGGGTGYPDGTVIAGPGGQKMIRKGGKWVPHN